MKIRIDSRTGYIAVTDTERGNHEPVTLTREEIRELYNYIINN